MAYSVSHFKGDNPTITYLNKFEREEYGKKSKETSSSVEDDHKRSLIIYEANKIEIDSYPFATLIPIISVIFLSAHYCSVTLLVMGLLKLFFFSFIIYLLLLVIPNRFFFFFFDLMEMRFILHFYFLFLGRDFFFNMGEDP